jgi:hypothetical protein
MAAKTMAEVLAEHSVDGMSGGAHLACRCNRTWVRHHEYRAHLEAALSAAGFGLVADAKAEGVGAALTYLLEIVGPSADARVIGLLQGAQRVSKDIAEQWTAS